MLLQKRKKKDRGNRSSYFGILSENLTQRMKIFSSFVMTPEVSRT